MIFSVLILSCIIILSLGLDELDPEIDQGIISLQFGFYLPTTYLTIGLDNNRDLNAPINTEADFSWVDISRFENHSSQLPSLNTTKRYHGIDIKGQGCKGNISLSPSIKLNDFPYLITNRENTSLPYVSLGFAYNYTDSQYSLIHYLKSNNIINRKVFGLIPQTTYKGRFYIGGIPLSKAKKPHHSSCRVQTSKEYPFWSCDLEYVIFNYNANKGNGDYIYVNPLRTYFTLMKDFIMVPKSLMKEFIDNVFGEAIRVKNCSVGYLDTVSCKCDYANAFGRMTFVFDGYGYELEGSRLFDQDIDFDICTFIMSSHYKEGLNHISIGISFIRHFDVFFDYEDSAIHIYSLTEVNKVLIKDKSGVIAKGMCISLFGLLGIGSVLLFLKKESLI